MRVDKEDTAKSTGELAAIRLSRRALLKGAGAFALAGLAFGMGCALAQDDTPAADDANAELDGGANGAGANGDPARGGGSTDTDSTSGDAAPRAITVVFSCSGNTLSVAEAVHARVGGDFFRLLTVEPYPEDYDERVDQGRRELDEGFIPELMGQADGSLAALLSNWDAYELVYLGFPTWWGHIPQAVRGFLEQFSLNGKTVAPFNTSHSSGWAQTLLDVAELAPDAVLLDGLAYTQETLPADEGDVAVWAEGVLAQALPDTSAPIEPVRTLTLGEEKAVRLVVHTDGAEEREFSVELANNETADAFAELLPCDLAMNELNGNEKYCYLDEPLPSAPAVPDGIEAGDVMLYGDSCLVVFYESFSTSYSYTRIGHITDTQGLADALGSGDVSVTFERM